MSDPVTVARRWFREVWDEGRESAIDELMAPDAVAHGLGGPPMRGPAEFKPFYRTFLNAFGDLEVEILRTVVQGDTVAVHCHVTARHVGEALGGPATHKPVEFEGVTILRVVNGKIVEGWNAFDFLTMYQQMGWVKAPVVP
ncbi:MAG TPA: ester cyclase [Vicinamibacterales bacterium]|jgi:steroid delta-isomerase-like uncharacterized protein|nr:ester cyclase [Vicinamibacterales bacterium]